jgi:hypothetical protein
MGVVKSASAIDRATLACCLFSRHSGIEASKSDFAVQRNRSTLPEPGSASLIAAKGAESATIYSGRVCDERFGGLEAPFIFAGAAKT